MEDEVEITTTSKKGQVVIPQEIRQSLDIKSGTKFAVYGREDTIIFKKLEMPTVRDFEKLVDWGVKFAKKGRLQKKMC